MEEVISPWEAVPWDGKHSRPNSKCQVYEVKMTGVFQEMEEWVRSGGWVESKVGHSRQGPVESPFKLEGFC